MDGHYMDTELLLSLEILPTAKNQLAVSHFQSVNAMSRKPAFDGLDPSLDIKTVF